jgi:hypothetical protein
MKVPCSNPSTGKKKKKKSNPLQKDHPFRLLQSESFSVFLSLSHLRFSKSEAKYSVEHPSGYLCFLMIVHRFYLLGKNITEVILFWLHPIKWWVPLVPVITTDH